MAQEKVLGGRKDLITGVARGVASRTDICF